MSAISRSRRTRVLRLVATSLTAVMLTVASPTVVHPDGWCDRFPWWPTCQRVA